MTNVIIRKAILKSSRFGVEKPGEKACIHLWGALQGQRQSGSWRNVSFLIVSVLFGACSFQHLCVEVWASPHHSPTRCNIQGWGGRLPLKQESWVLAADFLQIFWVTQVGHCSCIIQGGLGYVVVTTPLLKFQLFEKQTQKVCLRCTGIVLTEVLGWQSSHSLNCRQSPRQKKRWVGKCNFILFLEGERNGTFANSPDDYDAAHTI